MQQILGSPSQEVIDYYTQELIDLNTSDLFKRCCRLEKSEKMSLFDMLRSSPAFMKLQIYPEQDLKDAAELIELCLNWIPKDRITAE
jgi:hypothetical protein